MSVVLVPLRPGLLPLPPVQYVSVLSHFRPCYLLICYIMQIYSCSYYDGEEISHKADAGKLPSYMASPAAETMLQGTPKTVPKVVSTADALVDLTTPAKRRKSHTMSTPEQLGLTLFQQQQHLPASPSSIIGGRRKKRVTLDPLLSFPEACALVQPDEQIIVPAFSSSFHGTKESVQ